MSDKPSPTETPDTTDFVSIVNVVHIDVSAEVAWKTIGAYGDAGRFLGVSSVLLSDHDEIGSTRRIGEGILEVKVGAGVYSYAYMQTVGPMAAFAYHGNVSVEPTGEKHCRLIYTISYDQALMSNKVRRETSERIAPRFKGMAEAMRAEAEKGS